MTSARPAPRANRRGGTFILLGAIGALAACGWFAYDLLPRTSGPAPVEPTEPTAVTDARSAALLVTRQASDARLSALERRIDELESRGGGDRAAPTAATALVLPDPVEAAAQNERKVTHLDQALRVEPRDAAWSRETEGSLELAFEKGTFTGSSLVRTQCGSTFCAMLIKHDDYAARSDFERFVLAMPGMGGEFVYRDSPDGKPETMAYFIRPGHEGADHPVRRAY